MDKVTAPPLEALEQGRTYSGHLRKMKTTHQPAADDATVAYELALDELTVPFNSLLGRKLKLVHSGDIRCCHCGRASKKSFNQGYCYPCFKRLAQCDTCIMSPERCHHAAGTCREPDWADEFCMTDHIVYLANSTGVKVGITRINQVPTRWMDQGAIQALPIFRVATRHLSGLVEACFREHVPDRTNWRALLKGVVVPLDLIALRDRLFEDTADAIEALQAEHGIQAIQPLREASEYTFRYPVAAYQSKVKTHNFDKTPVVEGVVEGIKGQYLLLDTGAINLRKFTAYHVAVTVE